MFLFYLIWGFFYFILDYSHSFIENNFLVKNNPFLIRKRTFKFLSYFEKILLVLFYRKGWFEKSIANLYRKKDILDCRRNFYPTIYSFHINHDKVSYDPSNLKLMVKQYNYFFKNKFYNKKFNKIFNICFNVNNRFFLKYLMLQNLLIHNYYNLNSYFFYIEKTDINLVKLNRLFNIFLIRSSKKLINFNLDRWYDWYNFNFNTNISKYLDLKHKLSRQDIRKIKEFKLNKISKWINVVFKYKKRIIFYNKFFEKRFNGIIFFKVNLNNFFKIKINGDFSKLLKYYTIKFSESSVSKHINEKSIKKYSIQYLRKNRIFNKGRYSRNRQLYRTGVYWCLWLNIIMVYGLYFMFYRFTFNFGYFWWGILILCYSTIFSRISKYNFYNINYLYKEFFSLVGWYGFIVFNLFEFLENYFKSLFLNINIFNYISKYKNNNFSFFYDNYYYYLIKFVNKFINKKKRIKIVYMWQGMKEKDNSFLRYKTFIHWVKEIYRLIIT